LGQAALLDQQRFDQHRVYFGFTFAALVVISATCLYKLAAG
jgi:hypothetical protein